MKQKRNRSDRRRFKGVIALLDEMYINAMVTLAVTLGASIIVPLSVLSACLIFGRGAELWYGGDAENLVEAALATLLVGLGGSLLLDVAHKQDSK